MSYRIRGDIASSRRFLIAGLLRSSHPLDARKDEERRRGDDPVTHTTDSSPNVVAAPAGANQ